MSKYPAFLTIQGKEFKVTKCDYRLGYITAISGQLYGVPHNIDCDISFTKGFQAGTHTTEQV